MQTEFKNSEKGFSRSWLFRYFYVEKKIIFLFKLLLLLYVPFVIVSVYCLSARCDQLLHLDLYFIACALIGSIWFVIGPYLIYRFIKDCISFTYSAELNGNCINYFKENLANHYKYFIRNTIFCALVFNMIVIGAFLRWPQILTNQISRGYSDFLYWIILILLAYFLCYCSTAMSAIILTVKIIADLCYNDVIKYKPIVYLDYTTIKFLSKFSNRITAYFCSGMLFLPFIWYFLFYREEFHVWVIALLALYSSFLFVSITIPKIILSSYKKDKIDRFIMKNKEEYSNRQRMMQHLSMNSSRYYKISHELRLYNTYCFISNIEKMSCVGNKILDFSTVITYISIAITALSLIVGLLQM